MASKLPAIVSLLAVPIVAASSPPTTSVSGEQVRVVVVGTFHMDAAGDTRNPTVDEVLGARRQAQIGELVERLAEFKPTKIAIESLPSSPVMQEQFERYLRNDLQLGKDERHQVAFRLARRVGLSRVDGIDYDLPIQVEAVFTWAHQNNQSVLAAEMMAAYSSATSRWSSGFMDGSSILEIYRVLNSPETDRATHSVFTSAMRIGTDQEPVGATVVSRWYERNTHIAANVIRLAEPGDRILVLIGANHRKLLIELLSSVAGIDVVEARTYLGGA